MLPIKMCKASPHIACKRCLLSRDSEGMLRTYRTYMCTNNCLHVQFEKAFTEMYTHRLVQEIYLFYSSLFICLSLYKLFHNIRFHPNMLHMIMHIMMYAYVYVCMHACMDVWVYGCMHACMRVGVCKVM